jgi:hypothetical protein
MYSNFSNLADIVSDKVICPEYAEELIFGTKALLIIFEK